MDLNQCLEGMLDMLGHLIGEDIHIERRPANDLWRVKLDPSQIDQIMVNLCVNARDAIDDVGTITIETQNVSLDSNICADNADTDPGDYVQIRVSDTGRGMDDATKAQIFEPFFTTKDVGQGTGLGLATVYGIVKQNHGFINVSSEPGQGTTFTICLPRSVGEAELPVTAEEPPKAGVETILLVEDEVAIMDVTKIDELPIWPCAWYNKQSDHNRTSKRQGIACKEVTLAATAGTASIVIIMLNREGHLWHRGTARRKTASREMRLSRFGRL